MEDFEVGKDVVLKEREVMKELLVQLPLKAQLGFSTLKDQMTQRGEHGFRKLLHSARPHDSIKLEYTCLDISGYYIVLGCNLGLVFFYDRQRNKLNRFVCEVKHAPVTCTRILESQSFVASGQFNGNLTIFHYALEKNGVTKPLLKCTVEAHHVAPITAIQWTPDGTKLFTGDSEGHVAITVINMDEGQTHTVFICQEESPVVQLSFSHTALLISTLRRSLVWPFNTKTPVQVGQQERKIFGNFGACFVPTAKAVPSELQPAIYASRPGLRIWKATMEGKVLVTMFFKESVMQGEPQIHTLGLPSKGTVPVQQEQRQFGVVEVLNDTYLVSYLGPSLWVIDPLSGRLIGCHGNLGCVLDIAVFQNEIFVLTKGEEHFIRKITFGTRAQSPIIEVKELNLDDDDVQNEMNIRRSSSVNQFEENDKLERLIDDVGSTMVGIISGVKSTVARTIGQMTVKDESEEERSDGGYGTSGSYSSPKTMMRALGIRQADDATGAMLVNRVVTEDSSQMNGSCNSSPESMGPSEDPINPSDSQFVHEKVSVVVEHKERESEAPFQHLVQADYPEIVFEGTSKGIPVTKKKKKKKRKHDDQHKDQDADPVKRENASNPFTEEQIDVSEDNLESTEHTPEKSEVRVRENAMLEGRSLGHEGMASVDANPTEISEDHLQAHDNINYMPCNTDSEVCKENNIKTNVLSKSLSDSQASLSGSSCISSTSDEDVPDEPDNSQEIDSNKLDETEGLLPEELSSTETVTASTDIKQPNGDLHSTALINTRISMGHNQIECSDDSQVNTSGSKPETQSESPSAASLQKTFDVTSDRKTSAKGFGRGQKSHKKGHSLSALIDFQLGLEKTQKDAEITSLRDRVQRNFKSSNIDTFKSKSSSMDSLNVTSRVPLFLPPYGQVLCKPELRDTRSIPDSSRPRRRISGSSSISSTACSEQGIIETDDNILNVEIQDSYLEKSSSSERCKTIDGEAVERTFADGLQPSCGEASDDSILADVMRMDNEEERVEVKESRRVKAPHEPSPFPPPQISALTSIYSQETVSLSDLCFSEASSIHDDFSDLERIRSLDQDGDSSAVESIDSGEIEDIDGRDTPPVNLDTLGGVEMTDLAFVRKQQCEDCLSEDFSQVGDSEPENEKDYAIELSASAYADRVSERLRLLADSWAETTLPNCGQVQSLMVTDSLAWCIDNHDHIFYSPSTSLNVNWKRLDGRARLISSNQAGTVVWAVCRKRCAYYRTNIKDGNPQGSDWEPVEKDVLCVAVDDTGVWGIKMNGDVFVRPGVSASHPEGRGWRTVRVASDLVQISCVDGVVWALDIYNHVQVYQVEPESVTDDSHVVMWKELPGISASYVRLGPKGVCWIIDRDGGIWFNLEVSQENPFGSIWYQLSWSDSFLHDTSLLSSVMSYFKQDHDPKSLVASDNAGVWILSKYGKIRVSRGHLLGTRWEPKCPSNVSSTSCWTCVSAQGSRLDREFIWALQPNGKLHCFSPDGRDFVVPPPPKTVLKYISASLNSVWALTSGSDVFVRRGVTTTCPQGAKWTKVDMTSQGQEKLCHICAGSLVVWAVDYKGNIWFQMGKEEQRHTKVAPAWLQVDGCPFDGCQLIKVVVGAGDLHVWAIDDRNNVYVRKDVTDNFLIGLSWEVVPGTGAKDLAISDNLVWALCPNGDVICRYGVSAKNCMGDYWKKAPGSFDQISVGGDNELWGIDRQGQLYQRQTIHFFGAQSTKKAPSYSQLFPTDDDWELI